MLLLQPSLPSTYNSYLSIFSVCLLMLLNLRGLKELPALWWLLLPLYLQYRLSLALWVLSNHHRFPKTIRLFPNPLKTVWVSPSFLPLSFLPVALPLSDRLRLFQNYGAISSKTPKERNAASHPLIIMPLFCDCGITFLLNYWMGITPQKWRNHPSLMQWPDSFFGHASYYLFQFSTGLWILSYKYWLSASLCWLTIWLENASTCPISLWKKGIVLATPTVS